MDIRHMAAAAPTPQAVADKEKAAPPQEQGEQHPFAQLLQDAQPLDAMADESASALAALSQTADAAQLVMDEAADLSWSVDSLLGQHSQATEQALQAAGSLDGVSAALAQSETLPAALARWSGQPSQLPTAVGHTVSIVASGVQAEATQQPVAAATSVLLAAEVAAAVDEAVADAQDTQATDGEGRWSLQGAWRLQDTETAPPAVQRLVGQIEQWAAQAAGIQRKPEERATAAAAGVDAGNALAQAGGSGTRLTEQAVREAQSAQQAGADATPDVPTQDMRFWLQGRQQRAEVVMDHNGQAVRVQVSVTGQSAHITLRSDEAQTRAMLDAGLDQLRDLLQQQGLELAGVSVQADGRQSGSGQGQSRGAAGWEEGRVQHASIRVAPDGAVAMAGSSHRSAQGLDLYA